MRALSIFKYFRRLSRRRKEIEPPRIEKLNAILLYDAHLFWFSWGSLKLATHEEHITVPLKVHEHLRKFMYWRLKVRGL